MEYRSRAIGATAVAVAAVVIVAAVALGYEVVMAPPANSGSVTSSVSAASTNSTSSQTIEVTSEVVQDCQQAYPETEETMSSSSNGTSPTSVTFPVLFLAAGSWSHICVRYSAPAGSTYARPFNVTFMSASPPGNDTEITIGANATSLALGNGTSYTKTVSIVITAAAGAQGLYELLPSQFCTGIPLAVGFTPGQVSPASFSNIFEPRSCPEQSLTWQIVGYDSMQVSLLTYQESG